MGIVESFLCQECHWTAWDGLAQAEKAQDDVAGLCEMAAGPCPHLGGGRRFHGGGGLIAPGFLHANLKAGESASHWHLATWCFGAGG